MDVFDAIHKVLPAGSYKDAAAELRRQHEEIERLRAELAALQEDLRYVAHSGNLPRHARISPERR